MQKDLFFEPIVVKSKFIESLEKQWAKGNFVCVGLDSDYSQIPEFLKAGASIEDAIFNFNKGIIDTTADLVCAYKPNPAFYEAQGKEGFLALQKTVQYIKDKYPDVVVILDAKRTDIGNTNKEYAVWAFEKLNADAITVHPYFGREALIPFLEREDKGTIVLVRTSNPGAGEFQDLEVNGNPLYQIVAKDVARDWNTNGNCVVVVGATYPKELADVRQIIGDMPILIPGIGAQGGDLESTVKAGKAKNGGIIISSSRAIIFASKGEDFAKAARAETKKLRDEINIAIKND